jgi:hypothetical protein
LALLRARATIAALRDLAHAELDPADIASTVAEVIATLRR